MFLSIYTKSFGGKIWKNLHSVSPVTILAKKLNGEPLENILPKSFSKEDNLKLKPAKMKTSRAKTNFVTNLTI